MEPVFLPEHTNIESILAYYMGKNSMERQNFIIENLKVEMNNVEEEVMDLDEEESSIEA